MSGSDKRDERIDAVEWVIAFALGFLVLLAMMGVL